MNKLDHLIIYATEDASVSKLVMPSLDGLSETEQIKALAQFMAESGQFFKDDANLDNQKRNLCIRTFIDFSINEIRANALRWLDKFREAHGTTSWFKEWEWIAASATDDEIAKIYLSHDQESTRKRISTPSGLLSFDVALEVKRAGVPL